MKNHFRKKSTRKSSKGRAIPPAVYPVAGLVLLLPTAALWLTLFQSVQRLSGSWAAWWPLLLGFAVYGLVQWAFNKPMAIYVFGHEVTHATAAFLSGYKVKSLFVSEKGGEVQLSDTNAAVALAPYCVPLYTLAVLAVYGLVRRYAEFSAAPPWCGFAVGFTFSFHIALTLHALRQNQPDLRYAGGFFPLVAILFVNALVLALVVKALFPREVSFGSFLAEAAGNGRLLAERAWQLLEPLWKRSL